MNEYLTLREAAAGFQRAQDALKTAEDILNDAVDPYLQKASALHDYTFLLDELPPRYKGCRRIYEAMERLYPDPAP